MNFQTGLRNALKVRVRSCFRRAAQIMTWLPGGASLLSFFYFCLSSWKGGRPLRIFWDGHGWYRVESKVSIPLGPNFPAFSGLVRHALPEGDEIFSLRRKWWFRHYHPKQGDVILDIGAGYGEDTWVFAQAVGPEGRVLSVEAHPSTFLFLTSFIRYNRLPNVVPLSVAVSRTGGYVSISDHEAEDWQLNSISLSPPHRSPRGHRVPAQRIDEIPFVHQCPRVAFLKMNIEGAEVLALEGAPEALSRTQQVCICCHDFLGPATATKQAVCRLLQAAGFELFFTPSDSPPYERDFVYGKKFSA